MEILLFNVLVFNMTLMTHARICVLIYALAMIALGLGLFPSTSTYIAREWFLAAVAAVIISFVISQSMSKFVFGSESGKTKIADSKFERHALFTTVWLPVIISICAIGAILYLDVNPEKVGWVLVAFSTSMGHNLSNIYMFKRYD